MTWRVARSLDTLLHQLNTLAPQRSKASDGSIGDLSHQNRTSDHNPWWPPPTGGIVTARDFTHDPVHLHGQSLADRLAAGRDPRIKYIIWNRRIWQPTSGWRAYNGPNPHTTHVHLSVVAAAKCDDPSLWAGFIAPQPQPQPPKPDIPEDQLKNLVLAHKTGQSDIWAGDGTVARWVTSETALAGLQYWITEQGGDPAVHEIDDLFEVLGPPNPVQRWLPGYPLTDYPFDPPATD